MPADSILVIDAGTSALRACVVDAKGGVTLVHAEPWRMFVPGDTSAFGRELAAGDVVSSVRNIVRAATPYRERVAGMALTGQREGVAFVDGNAEAVLVSPNIDARAAVEGIAIDSSHADLVYRATGHLPSLMHVPAKYQWLCTYRPQDAARVVHALPLADWIAVLLTGEHMLSRSLGVENGMLDVKTGAPATALWETAGAPTALMPPVVADGQVRGVVRDGALKGAPVTVCGADTQCALVGMGAIVEGMAGVPAGWSAPVQLVTSSPVLDEQRRTWTGMHIAPNRWVLESNAGDTGRAWDWMMHVAGVDVDDAEAMASAVPAGSGDVITVLGVAAMRARSMTAGIGGVLFPLPLAMSAPDRGSMLRSVLEATACAIRANLEQIETISGRRVKALRLGGGMSRSDTFCRIVADVLERDVHIAGHAETSAVGAAVLAAAALRLHDDVPAAVEAMVRTRCTLRPDPRASSVYDDAYDRWLALSRACEEMAKA